MFNNFCIKQICYNKYPRNRQELLLAIYLFTVAVCSLNRSKSFNGSPAVITHWDLFPSGTPHLVSPSVEGWTDPPSGQHQTRH